MPTIGATPTMKIELTSGNAGLTGFVLDSQVQQLQIGGVIMQGCVIPEGRIGIQVYSDGRVAIGIP